MAEDTKKIKNTLLILAAIFTIGGLSFFFQFFEAEAKTLEENYSEGSCLEDADNRENYNHTDLELDTAKNKDNQTSLMPCCVGHDNATKIVSSGHQEIKSPVFYALAESSFSNYSADSLKDFFYAESLDLPPPEEESLSSIIKIE